MVKTYIEEKDSWETVTLADMNLWSEAVLDDLENANWHSARAAFEKLILTLPKVHKALLEHKETKLAQKLEDSTKDWDMYF